VPLDPRAEALLFAAARADLVAAVIRPAIEAGKIVIADRYIDSSLAYQGVARGLGIEDIARLNDWATGELMPDITLLIDVDPDRAAARGVEEDDRFEDEGREFQRKVAAAYDEIANRETGRITRINGDRTPEEVAADVTRIVGARLSEVPA
jgi:dTMP kinase